MPRRKPRKSPGCEKCNGTGFLPPLVTKKKPRRCPYCNRGVKLDRSGLHDLSADERGRVEKLLQQTAQTAVRKKLAEMDLPPELVTTDHLLQRWAVGHGSGLPYTDEELEELADAAQEQEDIFSHAPTKPPPLDDVTQTVIDQIVGPNPWVRLTGARSVFAVMDSRQAVRVRLGSVVVATAEFVWEWYCMPVPCTVMARDRGIDEAGLYGCWQVTLRTLRERFVKSGHEDLVDLVQMLL